MSSGQPDSLSGKSLNALAFRFEAVIHAESVLLTGSYVSEYAAAA